MYKRKNAQKFMLKHYLKDFIGFFCRRLKPLKGAKETTFRLLPMSPYQKINYVEINEDIKLQ